MYEAPRLQRVNAPAGDGAGSAGPLSLPFSLPYPLSNRQAARQNGLAESASLPPGEGEEAVKKMLKMRADCAAVWPGGITGSTAAWIFGGVIRGKPGNWKAGNTVTGFLPGRTGDGFARVYSKKSPGIRALSDGLSSA